jgi:LysR family nitrogen assimilation transcriptional regulator
MNFRQLRYFVGVAEAGSFTAAARQLAVAQPALSQHVLALEKELGCQLLVRKARGVRPTPSGAVFLEHAYLVLQDLDRAREAVSDTGSEIVGHVALGLPTTVAGVLSLRLMEAVFATLPRVTVHLVETHSGFLREWLDTGRLDLALLFDVADTEGLELAPLVVEDLHLLSAPRSADAGKDVALARIDDFDLFIASRSHGFRTTLEKTILLATGKTLRVKAEIDSVPTIKQLVMRGQGHTILPLSIAREELAAGTLVARRIVRPNLERRAALARVARRPGTRAQQAVETLLIEISRDLIADGVWAGRPLI